MNTIKLTFDMYYIISTDIFIIDIFNILCNKNNISLTDAFWNNFINVIFHRSSCCCHKNNDIIFCKIKILIKTMIFNDFFT